MDAIEKRARAVQAPVEACQRPGVGTGRVRSREKEGAVMARSSDHVCEQAGWPNPNTQNASLTLAFRMVVRYGHSVPSVETLRADFGISRATAYRWRRAFVEAVQAHAG